MPLRAALFDLDGTLIETHIDFSAMAESMRAMARQADVPEDLYAGRDILGIAQAATEDVERRRGQGAEFRRCAFAALEELEAAGSADPCLLPGTEACLAELRQRGIQIGIVTRNCRRVSLGLLERFAVPFDALLTRDDVINTKPDPRHLWDALHALGCAPGEAAMVGDHWMDIRASRDAGVSKSLGILGRHDAAWFAPCPPDALAVDLAQAGGFFS